jgi:hypothetical protein
MQTIVMTISPAERAGFFDVKTDGGFLAFSTRTPFHDGAKALLASGMAGPEDELVMQAKGSSHTILRGKVGSAAHLSPVTAENAATEGRTCV